MKKILITGKNSYVGIKLGNWLANYPDRYVIDKISLRNESWRKRDFSEFDVIVHVTGIAHRKETKENADLYYKVNRDLTYEVAQKAKSEGVKQFIFLSSMSVYGIESGVIDINSPLNPKSNYGKSKLEAEKFIKPLEDNGFNIAIIRPPLIYGEGCKGNYNRLSKLATKSPVFPDVKNQRSMIYIDNLCEFIKGLIESRDSGLYFPQNEEYVCTSELVKIIGEIHGKRIHLIKWFNPILKMFKSGTFNKVFGDLVYDKSLSRYEKVSYKLVNFRDSIEATEDSE